MSAGLKIGAIAALGWAMVIFGDAPVSAAAPASDAAPVPSDADAWRKVPYRAQSARMAKPKPLPDLEPFVSQGMPVYLVVGSHVLVDRGNNLATDKGKVSLAFREHPGLAIGNLFGLNAAQAPDIVRREDWAATKSDYRDLAHDLTLGGDPGEGAFVVKAVQNADLAVRAQDEKSPMSQVGAEFRVGQLQASTRLLQGPEQPIAFPVVRMKW